MRYVPEKGAAVARTSPIIFPRFDRSVSSFGPCHGSAGETFTRRGNDRFSFSFSCPIPRLRAFHFVRGRSLISRGNAARCSAGLRNGVLRLSGREDGAGRENPVKACSVSFARSLARSLFSFTPRDLGYRRVTAVTRAPREKVPAIVNSNRCTEETRRPSELVMG